MSLVLAAGAIGPGRGHAESIIPALHATMRTMRAALAQIGEFAKGDGAPPDALDAAAKVVTLAKSIPSIFPPGSELTELPTKTGAPPTTRSDVERFLDAEAIGRQQAKSASSWRRPNRAALSADVRSNTNPAAAQCRDRDHHCRTDAAIVSARTGASLEDGANQRATDVQGSDRPDFSPIQAMVGAPACRAPDRCR
jgi:cytochrome c556